MAPNPHDPMRFCDALNLDLNSFERTSKAFTRGQRFFQTIHLCWKKFGQMLPGQCLRLAQNMRFTWDMWIEIQRSSFTKGWFMWFCQVYWETTNNRNDKGHTFANHETWTWSSAKWTWWNGFDVSNKHTSTTNNQQRTRSRTPTNEQ